MRVLLLSIVYLSERISIMFYHIHLFYSVRRTNILHFVKPFKIFCGGEKQKLFCKDLSQFLLQDLFHDRTCSFRITFQDPLKVFPEQYLNFMT